MTAALSAKAYPKADLNLIDYGRLALHATRSKPWFTHSRATSARSLQASSIQKAQGYASYDLSACGSPEVRPLSRTAI